MSKAIHEWIFSAVRGLYQEYYTTRSTLSGVKTKALIKTLNKFKPIGRLVDYKTSIIGPVQWSRSEPTVRKSINNSIKHKIVERNRLQGPKLINKVVVVNSIHIRGTDMLVT